MEETKVISKNKEEFTISFFTVVKKLIEINKIQSYTIQHPNNSEYKESNKDVTLSSSLS